MIENNDQKKIVIVDTIGKHSGMHYHNLALAKIFVEKKCTVQVLSNYDDAITSNILTNFYTGSVIKKCILLLWSFVRYLIYIACSWQKTGLILYQSFGLRHIDMLFIFPLIFSRKQYVLIHDVFDINRPKKELFKRLQKFFYKYLLRRCIVFSETSLKELIHLGIQDRILEFSFPYLVIKDNYTMRHVRKDVQDSIQEGKKNLLFFGRIRETKGLDILLKAISMIGETYQRKMHLIIAGSDSSNILTGLLSEYSLSNLSVINRWINDDESAYLFKNCDTIVLPYKELYQSGVLDLSTNFNKPVIVSDHKVLVDKVEENRAAIIFKNGDSRDLSRAIKMFLDGNCTSDSTEKKSSRTCDTTLNIDLFLKENRKMLWKQQ